MRFWQIFAKIFVLAKSCAKYLVLRKFPQKYLFSESFRANVSNEGTNALGSLTFFAIFAQN
jgi:hypothetical protein